MSTIVVQDTKSDEDSTASPRKKLIYLGVQPTPYTQFLLENLRKSKEFDIDVYFTFEMFADSPWKDKLVHPEDKFFKRRFGIDTNILKLAATEKDAMFYVLGYNEPTKFMVLLIRMIRNYPYSYFNDSIKLVKNIYHLPKSTILPLLLSRAKAVFTTGQFGVDRFRKSGYAPKGMKFVDFPFFVPLPELSTKPIPTEPLTFLGSGRLVERKGFDDVIEALGKCKRDHGANFRYLLAGAGPLEDYLKGLVEKWNLEEEVEFLGWIEAPELQAIMRRAHVFVHYVPIMDPFPVAVLEAMAFGLPIVGSNIAGSVSDRVRSGVSGYVLPPSQVDQLKEALMKFIENPALCISMGEQARKTAEEWPVKRAERIMAENLW